MAEMMSHFVFPDPQATLRSIIVSQGFSRSNDIDSIGKSTINDNWVWVNTYRYIFSGMNIHLPAILGFTRYQGFDPSPINEEDFELQFVGRSMTIQPGFQFAVTRESGYLLHRGV